MRAADFTVAGQNLLFEIQSIQLANGQRVPMSGSGNVKNYGDLYFVTGTPALTSIGDPTYRIVDNETIYEECRVRFTTPTVMYTKSTWEAASLYGGTGITHSENWFTLALYHLGLFCETTGPYHVATSTISWNEYPLKPEAISGDFMRFSAPQVKVDWTSSLSQIEWNHSNSTAGLGVTYDFSYQFVDLRAAAKATVMDIGEYDDQIIAPAQTVKAAYQDWNGDRNYANAEIDSDVSGLPTSVQDALRAKVLYSTRGIKTLHVDGSNYQTWQNQTQSYIADAPTPGASYISAANSQPNAAIQVVLSEYQIRPAVYVANRQFEINWGYYPIIGTSDCWFGSSLGTTVSLAGHRTLETGGKSISANIGIHVQNKAIKVDFVTDMLMMINANVRGAPAEAWLGDPQLERGGKTWLSFLTGDQTAEVNHLSNYDFNNAIHDIGYTVKQIGNEIFGPILQGILILGVVILALAITFFVAKRLIMR